MNRYPAGFYILGIELSDNNNVLKRWSMQALRLLSPGEQWKFNTVLQNPSKCFSAHAWGLCRLQRVTLGIETFIPIDGALFIDIDRAFSPGHRVEVIVEALDFESLTTINETEELKCNG
jgi:hypothetical protein